MSSTIVKKVVGVYISDKLDPLPAVHRWTMLQCRTGSFAPHVRRFCESQSEILDPMLVLVENVTSEHIQCVIPCRIYDHESVHPYDSEVRFRLNPISGETIRID